MTEKINSNLWQIGGAKLSKSGERVNLSIIHSNDDGSKEYGTISINIKKGTKVIKVKVKPDTVILGIDRKDIKKSDETLEL